jgi:2-keto-4-pentenoate hydratase/2-oxohepta-3-ene-1,7-dioic acid hydratase in catechol pathway
MFLHFSLNRVAPLIGMRALLWHRASGNREEKRVNYRLLVTLMSLVAAVSHAEVSDAPDVAFKLATFETEGLERVGILIDDRLLDLRQANAYLQAKAGAPALDLPGDMKTLIEQSDTAKTRLFQIANYFSGRTADSGFSYDPDEVAIKAPIKYPWNLLAAGGNYRAHAAEMGSTTAEIDPDIDNPFLFAKSPRSTIIDPGRPYVIPPGRERIDWEGEFSIVIGRQAKNLTLENAMDYVFGFTIMYDVSDRAAQIPEKGRYARDWFSGKSMDNAAPMGPYITPREFLPDYANVSITTRVNGEIVQDSNTSYLIHDVEHLLRFATSRMTLWPGDVIATGTPAGVGAGRTPPVFLKPGDNVTIEVEGIGTLLTPIE